MNFFDARRIDAGVDWYFPLFVTLTSNDSNRSYLGSTTPSNSGASDRWLLPQNDYLVRDNGTTTIHESAHVFYALDEYNYTNIDGTPLSHTYNDVSGYYATQNTNAFHGNPNPLTRVPSVMSEESAEAYKNFTSSPQSLAMIGWQDSDGNGIFDVLDQPLTLEMTAIYDSTNNLYQLNGTSSVTALDNKFGVNRNDISINRIRRLEARVDGGEWFLVQAFDASQVTIDAEVTAYPGDKLELRTVAQIDGIQSPVVEFIVPGTPRLAPTITWQPPAEITYGTLLTSNELNATADVPGTFFYNPPLGSKLNAGASQSLSLTFTPADLPRYRPASLSRMIDVVPPPTVTLSRNNAAIAEAAETSIITATLSAVSSLPVTIDLGFTGTATLTSDYTHTATQIVIPAGQTTGTIIVTAVQDTLDEVDETIIVDITSVINGIEATPQQVMVTITDDDAPPSVTLSRNNATISEAAGTSIVTATLSAASSLPVTIDLGFSGTATLTSDYTRTGTQIVIPAGQTTGTVTVTAVQDALDEIDETIIVDITNVINGTEATPAQQVTVTITDDDAPPTVTLSRNNATIAEAAGTAVITATLSAVSSLPVTIDLGFSGTASLTSDYTRTGMQIVIAPGQTAGSVTITAVQDTLDEVDETIIVDITSVINGTEASPQQVTVAITDDDAPPTVTLSRNNATVAEAAGTAVITATLSAVSSLPVTIDLGFAGTATLTSDYTRTSTQIVIPAGQTTGSVTVTAVQDTVDEADETIVVDISSVINGTEATPQQVMVTITDDDEPLDFGDAPTTYPVTLAQNGARHAVSPLFLGENVDEEVDGIPSVNADSDDGDDGVVVLSTFISSTVATTSSVSVIASRPGKLDAWIDFNNDGDWSDAGERIFTSVDIVAGANLLSFTVPARATSGSAGARFRLSTAGGLAPTGAAPDGEVEDYLAVIVAGSATADLRIDLPGGDANAVVEGDNLVVRKGTTIISQVPFASFGELSINGSPLDDVLQLTLLEAFATTKLVIDGGQGKDFLELVEAGQTLDLTDANVTVREIEGIDIRGTGDNTLVISIDSVRAVSSTTSTLEVISNAGDTITFGDGWRVDLPQFIDGQFTHVISEAAAGGSARVEVRNDRFFTNPLNRFDVDRNGSVQPLDALRIINAIRRLGSGPIALPTNDGEISNLYFDVSGDNNLTALDALRVINAISRINRGVEPEGESALQPVDLDAFGKDTTDQPDVIDMAISEFETPAAATSFGSVQPPQPSVTNIDDWMEEFGTDESAEDVGLTSKLSEKMSAALSSEAD